MLIYSPLLVAEAPSKPVPLAAPAAIWKPDPTKSFIDYELWPTDRFGTLRLYRGKEDIYRTVIFFTGKDSWNDEAQDLVLLLKDEHTLLIGVDFPQYITHIKSDPACRYLAGEIVRLGQSIQNERDVAEPLPLVVAGIHEGADFADDAYRQFPKDFLGELLLFEKTLDDNLELCPDDKAGAIPQLKSVSIVTSENSQQTINPEERHTLVLNSFRSAEDHRLAKDHIDAFFPSYERPTVSALPIIFEPAGHQTKKTAVIFLSGDGGWADIDQDLSRYLNKNGYSVLGFDALKFFWTKKDAEEVTNALVETIKIAEKEYKVEAFAVIGFSLGADSAPFMVAGLPEEVHQKITSVVLLNPGKEADFEIHIADWLGVEAGEDDIPIKPALEKIHRPVLCLLSEDQEQSACRDTIAGVQTKKLPGDHHFNGDYATLASIILNFLSITAK